jgi:malonyl-CoA O-methyltransferase
LEFEDNISKFRYIKKSGVSSGKRELGYKETKELIRNYPLNYLEFEVLFVWGKSR